MGEEGWGFEWKECRHSTAPGSYVDWLEDKSGIEWFIWSIGFDFNWVYGNNTAVTDNGCIMLW